jgi:hypothetical protein
VLDAGSGALAVYLDAPGIVAVEARWVAEDGSPVAANSIEIACVATPPAAARLRVLGGAALVNTLRALGYNVAPAAAQAAPPNGDILVAARYTGEVEAYVQAGGRAIVLADSSRFAEYDELAHSDSLAARSLSIDEDGPECAVPLPVGCVVARSGTAWQGDWANSFAWMKKQGPLGHFPGSPLLEMEWAEIMPDAVITRLPPWVLRHHSWAGLAVGWVHKAVSLLAVIPYGKGRMLVTTFKLNAQTLAGDAVAQALFAGLVNLIKE